MRPPPLLCLPLLVVSLAAASKGGERRSIIEQEMAKTIDLFRSVAPGTEVLAQEYLPEASGGSGYLAVFMPGGSNISKIVGDGPKIRLNAARSAMLVFRGGWLLRVSAIASTEQPEPPDPATLEHLRDETLALADSVQFAPR